MNALGFSLLGALAVTWVSGTVHAQADSLSETREGSQGGEAPPYDIHFAGHLGGYSTPSDEGGVVLGTTAKIRSGILVGGALFETGGGLLSDSFMGAAALAGVSARLPQRLRFELLGAVGYHHYEDVGKDWLFGSNPGASGGMPYAGGRVGASYLFGKRTGHFELGLYANYDHDLERERVRYSYYEGAWLFGGEGEVTSEQTIGMSRFGMGVELGGTHDWF
ncbi:MAG TPA: hypothetical protein VK524_31650 [Polyangiaceae bacterium]|nr:hypothetical protein [Polyangiaceae bacterium]